MGLRFKTTFNVYYFILLPLPPRGTPSFWSKSPVIILCQSFFLMILNQNQNQMFKRILLIKIKLKITFYEMI